MNILKLRAGTAAILALFALPAGADVINVGEITASWVDPAPGFISSLAVDNSGDPITVSWGIPGTFRGQSGYSFDDTSTPFTADTDLNDGLFFLGEFTHHNNPISGFSVPLESVGLSISVSIGGAAGDFGEVFTLFHNETPNVPGPGDDIVTFSAGTTNSFFTVAGNDYFIRLLGFSTDGGATLVESFSSPEGGSNTAGLWGQFVEGRPAAVPVPAPSTLLLLGAGLLGLAAIRRR